MKEVWRMVLAVLFVVSLVPAAAWAGAELGQVPPKVELKDDIGGRLDGKPWSSDELKGKVHVLFYVDPDEKDTNNETSEALDKEKFPAEKFQSGSHHQHGRDLYAQFLDLLVSQGETGEVSQDTVLARLQESACPAMEADG